jgi:hypothetical protein
MSAGLRSAVFATFGVLWASGCGWLVLHWFFEPMGAFGSSPHPWEPALLRVHGWLAAGGVFLLGWIAAEHIGTRWVLVRRRPSGVIMVCVAAALVISGYALYYTTDLLHDLSTVAHEVIGGAAIVFALVHWRANGRSASRS